MIGPSVSLSVYPSKDAPLKATKRLLESPEVREGRLHKDAALRALIFDFVNFDY